MHRIEKFEEEVFLEDARVTRIVYGIWKGNKVAIYKEDDDENYFIKNCDCVFMNGWMMSVPGETYRQYGQSYTVRDEEWYRIREPLEWSAYENQKALIAKAGELAVELYPSFKYVLKKWKAKTTCQLIEALTIWKEHPDIEFLLALGFENIAFSPAFYRLSDAKKKVYCKWMRENPTRNNVTYKTLQTIICHKLSWNEWKDYQKFINQANYSKSISISYPIYKYLATQIIKLPNNWTPNEIVREWEDYKTMAIRAGHNLKEDYWKWPSNLVRAHDKCMEEVARMEEAERIAKEKARQKKIARMLQGLRLLPGSLRIFPKRLMDFPFLYLQIMKNGKGRRMFCTSVFVLADTIRSFCMVNAQSFLFKKTEYRRQQRRLWLTAS